MYDFVIRHGTLVDGSGNPPYKADIAIRDERIAAVGEDLDAPAEIPAIEASDLVVCPGFIDIHSHSDVTLLIDPSAKSSLYQGVTTEVIGNCGLSCFPVAKENKRLLQAYIKGLGYDPSLAIDWENFNEYAGRLEANGLGINIAPLVGHGSLRIAVMGFEAREAYKSEQERMSSLLNHALDQGAFGMSTGLIYPPGINASTRELENLCTILSKRDAIYSTHLRGDFLKPKPTLVESLEEAILITRNTGVRLQVSHIDPKFPDNGVAETTVEMMQRARDQGFQVTCDMHPYLAGMTFLSTFLPPWVFEGGTDETIRRLTEKKERQKILDELRSQYEPLGWKEFWSIGEPLLANAEFKFRGKRFLEIGKMTGQDPAEVYLSLLADQGEDLFNIYVLLWVYSADESLKTFHWPYTAIGADGVCSSKESDVGSFALHPRSWGTFPKAINDFSKGETHYPLEGTVHKMTGLPAMSIGLKDRGFIREGLKADIVIFDLERMKDSATYTKAKQYAEGVEYVMVNGNIVIEKGKWTDRLSGRVLRKN